MDKLAGYRTYITAGVLLLHQILKTAGIDIPQESLSTAADTVLILLVGLFRYLATKHNENIGDTP